MNEKITYDKLVDPSAFPQLYKDVEGLIVLLTTVQQKITTNLSAMKSAAGVQVDSAKTLADLQNALNKIKEQDEALNKLKGTTKLLTLEQAKQRLQAQEYNKVVKDQAKIALDMTTEYQRQSKSLIELRKQAQAVLLANQENTVSGKALIAQYTELDQKLKKVDDTLGQHQRHIGNYTHSVINAFKATGGFAGALDIVGKIMGVDEETLRSLTDAHHTLASAAKDLHHITAGETHAQEEHNVAVHEGIVATEEMTVATEAETVATEEATVATEEMTAAMDVNPIFLIIAAISAFVGVVAYLTLKENESEEAVKDFNAAVGKQQEEIAGLSTSIENLTIDYKVLAGQMSKTAGEVAKTEIETTEKRKKAAEEYREARKKIIEDYEKEQSGFFTSSMAIQELEEKKKAKLEVLERNFNTILLNIQTEGNAKKTNAIQENTNKETEDHQKHLDDLLKLEEDYWKKLRDLRTQNIIYNYDREKQLIWDHYNDESKKYAGHTEILVELDIERDRKLKELYRKQQAEWDKIRKETKDDSIKKVQDDAKKEAQDNADPAFSPQLKANIELASKEKELREKQHKEQVDAALSLAEQLEKIEKEHVDKVNALHLAKIDHDIDKTKQAIDIQLRLAEAGQANTLESEMKHQDELEKARVQELERQKKVARQQEEIALGLAFIKSFEKELEAGKSPGAALSAATTEIIAAKLIGKALSGSAFDGTEDTGSDGDLDGKGGMLWMLHRNERVVNADDNAKLNGMSNEKLVANALMFENIMKPQFDSSISSGFGTEKADVQSAVNSLLIKKVETLTEVIKNKPENNWQFDHLGNLIHTRIEGGLRRLTIKQTYLKG